jgi:hypothetical protein
LLGVFEWTASPSFNLPLKLKERLGLGQGRRASVRAEQVVRVFDFHWNLAEGVYA